MTKKTLAEYFKPRPQQGLAKLASTGQKDPGPDSNHPASIAEPIVPPTGETMADAASKPVELVGDMAVTGGTEGSVKEKKPETLVTQTGTVDTVPTTPIKSNAPDLGSETGHPASSGQEKFAACASIDDVLKVMQDAISDALNKVAAAAEAEVVSQPKKAEAPSSDVQPSLPDVSKIATLAGRLEYLTTGATPGETGERRMAACSKVAGVFSPLVQHGVALAKDFAHYTKLASIDPAAAAQLIGAPLPPEGGAGGMPEGVMPPDPAMMGGAPADAGSLGGDITPEALMAAIEQLAAQEGKTPEELLDMLEDELEGSSEGSESGEGAPPADVPSAAAEPMSGAALTGGESEAAPAADPTDGEEPKTAAAPEVIAKLAKFLSSEVGLTIPEVAKLRSTTVAG